MFPQVVLTKLSRALVTVLKECFSLTQWFRAKIFFFFLISFFSF